MKLLLALILLVLFSCGSSEIAGSSSDVDIITGTIVTASGATVKNAKVYLYNKSNDTSVTKAVDSVCTDSVGNYRFSSVGTGKFGIQTKYKDSLFAYRNNVVHSSISVTKLSSDTLFAPGVIVGTVKTDSITNQGVLIYIPGTSYVAYSDEKGEFTIPKVPASQSYTVVVQMFGYATYPIKISVSAGDTTDLGTVVLVRNNFPTGVTAVFDPLTKLVRISWKPFAGTDVGYIIYRKDSRNDAQSPVQLNTIKLCKETFFVDPIYEEMFSKDDTIPLQYHVKAKIGEQLTAFSNKAPVKVYTQRDSTTKKKIVVISPNETPLKGGTSTPIIWEFTGLIDSVTIDFSSNNGESWNSVTTPVKHNNEYWWKVPNISAAMCRIRVTEKNSLIPTNDLKSNMSEIFSIEKDTTRNLLINGDFSQGTSGWKLNVFDSTSDSTGTASGSVKSIDGEIRIDVDTATEAWRLNYHQYGFTLLSGVSYKLSFDARGSEDNLIVAAAISRITQPWATATYDTRQIVVNKVMKRYSVIFNMGAPDDANSVFSLYPGIISKTHVFFDNVVLEKWDP